MISGQRLIGMCAVEGGRVLGQVERVVLGEGAAKLYGIVLRRGLGAAKWIPRARVILLGSRCVLVEGRGERPPKKLPEQPKQVKDLSGLTIGTVTDAMLGEKSMRVLALEISFGTMYRLMGQGAMISDYHVNGSEVVAKCLMGRERGTKLQ